MHYTGFRDSAGGVRARTRRIGTRCAVVSVAAGLIASACGGSHHSTTTTATVNPARVAAAIAASVRHDRHVDASVTCPSGVPLRAHATFYCVAQVGSRVTPFHVNEIGATGHVTYVGVSPHQAPLLGTASVARAIVASIKSSRGVTAVVRCPVDIPMQRGLAFACTATTRSGSTHFEVRQTDGHGHVTYHAL
jgi:hypothetical protein